MLREEIGHRHSLREKFQPANVIPVGSSATRKLSERVVSFLYGRRELCCDASFPENYLVDLLFARMGPVATAHCGSSLVCAGNYSGVKLGGLGAACSARSTRWSPWPRCVKTASEAGLEAWIGRCNTVCDAFVTRRDCRASGRSAATAISCGRADKPCFNWSESRWSHRASSRKIALGPSLERPEAKAYDLATNPLNRDCVLHSW